MVTAHSSVNDMLVTVKSQELQRGMLAEMRNDHTRATRHFLAAAHLELVLADDYMETGQLDLTLRSHLSAASCFWRACHYDQARALFMTLLQKYPTQTPTIWQTLAELERDYPKIGE